jgi:hypothetical protein
MCDTEGGGTKYPQANCERCVIVKAPKGSSEFSFIIGRASRMWMIQRERMWHRGRGSKISSGKL